jgi:DNA polymerase III gamma/tau subunit
MLTGVSLIEARVEAAKLSKNGKIFSIMEMDGDFNVEEGNVEGAYMQFKGGSKVVMDEQSEPSTPSTTKAKTAAKATAKPEPVEKAKPTKKARPVIVEIPDDTEEEEETDVIEVKPIKKSKNEKKSEPKNEKKSEPKPETNTDMKTKNRPAAKKVTKPAAKKVAAKVAAKKDVAKVAAKKDVAKVKDVTAKADKPARTPDKPFKFLSEWIEKVGKTTREAVYKKLIGMGYAESTSRLELSLLKNHPQIKVDAEGSVKWVK